MKILFQGDSITDAGRRYDDCHDLGNGYPKFAAQAIQAEYPDQTFEFVNLGISGNQTKDLVARLQKDFIDVDPDIVSIMIGINDVWHHAEQQDWLEHDVFEQRYRTVLQGIRQQTHARIMILEPYLLPVEDKLFFRQDLDPKIGIVRRLAREYADVYLPTDGLLHAALLDHAVTDFSADGVHPAGYGCEFIGRLYARYIKPLIEQIQNN